jgi:hypothetical protein
VFSSRGAGNLPREHDVCVCSAQAGVALSFPSTKRDGLLFAACRDAMGEKNLARMLCDEAEIKDDAFKPRMRPTQTYGGGKQQGCAKTRVMSCPCTACPMQRGS